MDKPGSTEGQSASTLIDEKIAQLGDWRGPTLGRMRKLILEAAPDVVEEWKWRGTPVWSHGGILCTGESYLRCSRTGAERTVDPREVFANEDCSAPGALITFRTDGSLAISSKVSADDRAKLGPLGHLQMRPTPEQAAYLTRHNEWFDLANSTS